MYASREAEVCLHCITTTQITFDTAVDLIAFRNSQRGIQATREVCIQHTEIADQSRIHRERFGKAKVGGDERAPLLSRHDLTCERIAQQVGVEKVLLFTQREVVDGSQQWAVEEDSSTEAQSKPSRIEWAVGGREPWTKIVFVVKNRFVLVAQTVTQQQLWQDLPFVLEKHTGVEVLLCRRALKRLPKATRNAGQEITGTCKVESPTQIREVDKRRTHVMNVSAELE